MTKAPDTEEHLPELVIFGANPRRHKLVSLRARAGAGCAETRRGSSYLDQKGSRYEWVSGEAALITGLMFTLFLSAELSMFSFSMTEVCVVFCTLFVVINSYKCE